MIFKDHFSGHARQYASARPTYPEGLFDFLAVASPATGLVWDAGCGNGQAARALARRFTRVYATDASEQQIAAAAPDTGLEFHCQPAENCGLPDHVADLVTAAQAAHWFDLPAFYHEVRRVLKPGGVLALWSYGINRIDVEIDRLVYHLYAEVLKAHWPPERPLVESGYATLAFPFPHLPAPEFDMRVSWSVEQYLAYLRSWSASQRYRHETGADPIAEIEADLRAAWGPHSREVDWPLALLATRMDRDN